MNEKKEFVFRSTLSKKYGLTPSMVAELDPPDDYCDNPYYANAAPGNLYKVKRVEKWIEDNSERVEKAKVSRANRSATAAVRREARQAEEQRKAIEWSKTVEITLAAPLPDTLVADARARMAFRGCENVLEERAILAHVRHQYTNYDSLRRGLRRHECGEAMYEQIRARTDEVAKSALMEWAAAKPEFATSQPPGEIPQAAKRESPVSRKSAPNCRRGSGGRK